jgi:putative ABC transport system substrate-binding protein
MSARLMASLLVSSLLAAPLAAEAQQGERVWRIGILSWTPAASGDPAREAFLDALRERGYVEGKNLVLERRFASPDPGRYPALAAELVAARVDVIVAGGNAAILAAKSVTTTIPIVMPWVFAPVETGIVASLARPGGNVTGLTWEEGTDQGGKKLQLFKQLVPTVSRMAVVSSLTVPGLDQYWPPFRTTAKALGIEVYLVEFSRAEHLDRALATILSDRPSAVFFPDGEKVWARRQAICDFALKNRFPMLAPHEMWTEAGCLLSYTPDMPLPDRFRRTAIYVDKILKGAKPADLPIEQPTKYKLVINGKTANALGLTIPQSLLLRADQIIE